MYKLILALLFLVTPTFGQYYQEQNVVTSILLQVNNSFIYDINRDENHSFRVLRDSSSSVKRTGR